ncbi:UPF0753 protein [Roseibium aquae]|uniref:Probable inorganic carbon transporter subunit DabA n=1 Tax=Roseibium aquae TaxID=1323746 RepID=A0A916X1F7_9HYPH|nr:DUF2309 domain-containing protein [Roseibium aquae]GGB46900.1 UPF0753 protein [Roseibium aquae]
MTQQFDILDFDRATLRAAADHAGRMIPPVWPLASSVAVNPFLGQTGETLAEAGTRLARIADIPVTMPRSWYKKQIEAGAITDFDLEAALGSTIHAGKPDSIEALKAALDATPACRAPLPTMADLASEISGTDWTGLIADRIGVWAGSYFDEGQALWGLSKRKTAWSSWRAYATHDLTPEIQGLKQFGSQVSDAPNLTADALAVAARELDLSPDALENYFHQLLLTTGGWAQYARHLLWKAELAGRTDGTLTDLLSIRLFFELALFRQYKNEVADAWCDIQQAHAESFAADPDLIINEIFQCAAERAQQRDLSARLGQPMTAETANARPSLQAAFCIDVRSEVFRRALEAVNPSIRTLGFAGFFGVFANHKEFASDIEELRLPVLLNPTVTSSACSHDAESQKKDHQNRIASRAVRAWGRFKQAAVSSFAFVEAAGPIYAGKLALSALGRGDKDKAAAPKPQFDPSLDEATKIASAETVLRAMSLTDGFAPLIVLAGHGANVVNNPHESGLHCGACGGYSGEVNARLLASLLNDKAVRTGLAGRGIVIPSDTVFIGALHDTTTDTMTLYDQDLGPRMPKQALDQARTWFAEAGRVARGERSKTLPRSTSAEDIAKRAKDWAETRPEWALARCKGFIAAPRSRTSGKSLEGRAFLHDYDWHLDEPNGYPVLELIMTAPVVVASWISLQYYGSTVAPQVFGSGNKLLHNVVGGLGVLEGNGGPLRAGLAWQSVHDGTEFIHEPLRLSVCIEAPVSAMTDILNRHPDVRALFDNGWLHLFALDDHGRMAQRYTGNLTWASVAADELAAAA